MSNSIINPLSPKIRRESTKKRRREILDAALKGFLEKGVAGTTIEQIRKSAKASHGSVYHLFSSKDEIALTLFAEGMDVYHQKIMQAMEAETTAFGCLRSMVETHLQDVVDDPKLSIYITRLGMADDVGNVSEQFRSCNDAFAEAVWSHLKVFVDRGELKLLPREIYFSLIVGPASHLARSWLRGRIDFDLMSATDDLANAAWKSLQPD